MINANLAKKFVEQITQFTDYNINIMDENGYIIASRDPERIGMFHGVAYNIMKKQEDIVSIFEADVFPGVKPGVNIALNVSGHKEGVVGITGNPEEVKPIAMIVKMAIEVMIKYEKQQADFTRRQNRKERFMTLLIHEKDPDMITLRILAEELGYSENIVRVPILLNMYGDYAETVEKVVKQQESHTSEDITFILDNHRILLFKTVGDKEKAIFDYRNIAMEVISELIEWMEAKKIKYHYYVGTLQSDFAQYYTSYQHCKWLELQKVAECSGIFFSDYVDSYLMEKISRHEMDLIFHVYKENLTSSFILNYLNVIGALMENNWNIAEAARKLYIHKNTLVYQYNKIRDKLNVNPQTSSSDRNFLKMLYFYFKNRK